MPTNEQQRRAITYLVKSHRDSIPRAPRLDEPGIMAALAKVHTLDVAMVTMAAMRLAADPGIKTPAMIGDPSSSVWREKVGPQVARRHTRPLEACFSCGGEYGPSCCDAPSQRPAPSADHFVHAAKIRAQLRSPA